MSARIATLARRLWLWIRGLVTATLVVGLLARFMHSSRLTIRNNSGVDVRALTISVDCTYPDHASVHFGDRPERRKIAVLSPGADVVIRHGWHYASLELSYVVDDIPHQHLEREAYSDRAGGWIVSIGADGQVRWFNDPH